MKEFLFSNVSDVLNHINTSSSKGFIIFSSVEIVVELSKHVSSNVILCSTSGEYSRNGYKDGVISGFEYDLEQAEIVEIPNPPIKNIKKLKQAYNKVKNNKNSFALLLCDGLNGTEESIVTSFYFTDNNFKIIGGSAGDNLKFKETFIFIGNKKINSVAIFFDMKRRTQIIKENIYESTGTRLLITDSDLITRTVKTFNKAPASTEYAKALNIREQDLSNYFINNPLGKIYEDETYIASPMKINPDKSITFYCQMMSDTFVEVLKPVNPVDQIRKTIKMVEFKPNFVLAINCILRSLKFQEDGVWKSIDHELLSLCPNITGFVSYGEQFYKKHVNQTMVLLAIE
jgi:hypothetical protein